MRVILMHNPTAGDEDHSARDLVRELERHDHEVVASVTGRKALKAAVRGPCDLVVAAGGDGTVNAVARVLTGTGLPFAVLPLGTANNLAAALGQTGDASEVIAAWSDGALRGFDRGVVARRDKTRPFMEAFGLGVFPEAMRAGAALAVPETSEARLERDLELFREELAAARPATYTISADGEDLSGDYLLVEVLNIASLGPNVPLAPGARFGDGLLELVLVGVEQRGLLEELLARRSGGRPRRERLPSRRVRRVVVTAPDRRYHLDGEVRSIEKRRTRHHFDVSVEPHALQVLVPPG